MCDWPGEVLSQEVFAGAPVEQKLFEQCGFAGCEGLGCGLNHLLHATNVNCKVCVR